MNDRCNVINCLRLLITQGEKFQGCLDFLTTVHWEEAAGIWVVSLDDPPISPSEHRPQGLDMYYQKGGNEEIVELKPYTSPSRHLWRDQGRTVFKTGVCLALRRMQGLPQVSVLLMNHPPTLPTCYKPDWTVVGGEAEGNRNYIASPWS